jgi:hypothetical protein
MTKSSLYAVVLSAFISSLFLSGCKSTPAPTPTPATPSTASAPVATFPPRPTVPPPPFKVFHHADNRFTLVTKDNASDDEIESLIWQLRDAAHAHTFDKIKITQKEVDADAPTVWFHIYRGTKCAAEKYATGPPSCGGSYHAAGDYTFDSHKNPAWDHGILLHGEDHEVSLWNPDAPYTAPTK